MATIRNSTNYTLSASAQEAISNAASAKEVDTIVVGVHSHGGGNGTLFNLYDEDDNYLFSIDTEGNEIFEN